MPFLCKTKNLRRLWAAVLSDFDAILVLFAKKEVGWTFEDFASLCRSREITLIMQCAVGSGITREQHYGIVCNMIFNCAKAIWLQPLDEEIPHRFHAHNILPISDSPDAYGSYLAVVNLKEWVLNIVCSVGEPSTRLKRKLGGFFLMYLMYMKQPLKNECKISLDLDDLSEGLKWKKYISGTTFEEEADFILFSLHSYEAFYCCLTADKYGFLALERECLRISKNTKVRIMNSLQGVHDEMAVTPLVPNAQGSFSQMGETKKRFRQKRDIQDFFRSQTKKSAKPDSKNLKPKIPHFLKVDTGLLGLLSPVITMKLQTNQPIFTIPELVGPLEMHSIIEETKLKLKRLRLKAKKYDSKGRYKVKTPYLTESGIFNRNMAGPRKEEELDEGKRRSNINSDNLWNYIHLGTFT